MSTPDPAAEPIRSRWAWAVLGLVMIWVALARVPLFLNARVHLDSDLSVDGLTLIDATRGHWRWHFPGTPHMGILPIVLSWPQAMIWGASPATLVSGGVVAYEALVVATFVLARRAFGAAVAMWALVPLAFASTGVVWLSGRLTGGHLLTAAWSAAAFALWHACLALGGVRRAAMLGLWCGLGLYLDRMFLFTLVGIAFGTALVVRGPFRAGRGVAALAFLAAVVVGVLPLEIGRRADPYDAYREQFEPLMEPSVLLGHARMFALECLPRLVAGHRLPGLQSDPSPSALGVRAYPRERAGGRLAVAASVGALGTFALGIVALMKWRAGPVGAASAAIRRGLLSSSAAIVAAFVINRNIYNSDNYRYLVLLLIPWSLGFGLAMHRLARRPAGLALAALASLGFAAVMAADLATWYRGFGWIDEAGRPVRREVADPALGAIRSRPGVTHVFGDYWDVYRLSFLTGGRVRGVPYPIYPNRYPGWSRGLGPGRGEVLVLRRHPRWPDLLAAAWKDDGRRPEELNGVSIRTWP
jgi:hypothetical protein